MMISIETKADETYASLYLTTENSQKTFTSIAGTDDPTQLSQKDLTDVETQLRWIKWQLHVENWLLSVSEELLATGPKDEHVVSTLRSIHGQPKLKGIDKLGTSFIPKYQKSRINKDLHSLTQDLNNSPISSITAPIMIEGLNYENGDELLATLDVLCYVLDSAKVESIEVSE